MLPQIAEVAAATPIDWSAIDYSSVTNNMNGAVGSSFPVALGFTGLVCGVLFVIRMVRRSAR